MDCIYQQVYTELATQNANSETFTALTISDIISLNFDFFVFQEELRNLYSSPDIIRQVKSRRMRWAGHVARMGEERKVYKVLVGKPEGKSPLGRPGRRCEDGIRMGLRGIGLGVWIGFDWLRTRTGGGLW
jgi:hypothetical protein